jgi:hypothetical protein
MKRGLALVSAGLCLVLVAPATAAPSDVQISTLLLERTTSGPASFTLTIDAQLSDQEPEGFIGIVSARVVGGRVEAAEALGANAFFFDYGVRAEAAEQRVEVCQPLGGCIVNRTLAYQSFTESRDDGGSTAANRLFVVVEGPAIIRFDGQGWSLKRSPLSYRWIESAGAGGSGVFTGSFGLQHFASATLPGGAGGSIATGAPPCSQARSGLAPRGLGTATLTGGQQEPRVTCPFNAGRPYLTDLARTATDWRLDGPVVGENTLANVPLFILDVPAEPRV